MGYGSVEIACLPVGRAVPSPLKVRSPPADTIGVRRVRWLAVLASVVASAGAAEPSPALCAFGKAKATGVRIAQDLACHATGTRKGTIASFSCLAAAESRFERLFAKADAKGACGMAGDATIIGDSVASFAEGIAAALFPPSSPDEDRHCASLKMLRTGAYGRGRLACRAHAFRAGAPIDGGCLDGVVAKLDRGFEKAEAKRSCATVGDLTDIGLAVDGLVDAVAGLLTPPATTTTTVPMNTTTTTAPPGGSTTTVPGGTTSTTTLAPGAVTLSGDVQPIFTANCAVPGCHTGAKPAQGLDLGAGHAYGSLVNVASGECPLFKRVLPTRPDQSYLVFKITGPPQPCFSGNQMPSGSAPPLSTADRSTISAWIMQGALND